MERERQRKREQERRRREAQVNKLTISNVVQMFIMHELSEGIYQEKTEQCVRGTKRGGVQHGQTCSHKEHFFIEHVHYTAISINHCINHLINN